MLGEMATPSDEALFAAYCDGDKAAFAELFVRYHPAITRRMARGLRKQSDVQDLVQQVFLQVHRARFDFDRKRTFRPWLFTVAMNLKRQYLRRLGRQRLDLEEEPGGVSPAYDPVAQDQRRVLREALSSLPPSQREVIELHWLHDMPFAEVSAVVGASVAAVKVRAHRGYQRLKVLIEKLERNPTARTRIQPRKEE